MTDNIKIDISDIKDNEGVITIKHQEWTKYYKEFYEIFFARTSGNIKMQGFRKGRIPSVLLEIKYPHLVEEVNEKTMFYLVQIIYTQLLKVHKNSKIKNYKVDKNSKDLSIFFSIKDEENNNEEKPKNTEEKIVKNKKEKKTDTKVTKTQKKPKIAS